MSAGHLIDHEVKYETHQGRFDLQRALGDRAFQEMLNLPYRVSFDYDIPYLGGYNMDGTVYYLDRDFRDVSFTIWGSYILAPQTFVLTHERWEKGAMLVWHYDYFPAHDLGTAAEHSELPPGLDPHTYERLLQPSLKHAAAKKNPRLPPDLDRTPYRA